MIRFDTLKISVPYPALNSFVHEKFINEVKTDLSTGEFEETYFLKKDYLFGFDIMALKKNKGEIILQFSAKALKNEYYDLINKNNIHKVFESINLSGIADINVSGAIDNAIVLKCDVTNNLNVSKDVSQYLTDLQILSSNLRYRVQNYSSGIVVMPQAKTNDRRYLVYDKYCELLRKTAINKELSRYVDYDIFKNILRTEGNLRTFEDMRYFFGLSKGTDPLLTSILDSSEKVALKYFDHIFPNDITSLVLPEPFTSLNSLNEVEKFFGKRAVIESCNYDDKTIRAFIKSKVKGNISPYMKDYRSMKKQLIMEKLQNDFSRINEIREILRNDS